MTPLTTEQAPAPIRVLLIEDNPADATLLRTVLGEDAGAFPCSLENEARLSEGLKRFSREGADVILLDLFLPDSSGIETLRDAIAAAPHVPIVVLTGLEERESAVQFLRMGAQDFLTKQALSAATLHRAIRYAIERYRLLEKLREEEERYYLVTEGSHDGLWDWNLKTGRVYFSPRWKSMLGFEGDARLGEDTGTWFDRIHPSDLERVKSDLFNHFLGRTEFFANEHRLRKKSGRYLWVYARGLATHDRHWNPLRFAGSFTDITRHKNMEQQLALRAFYDPLTGLPNRLFFMECLARAFANLKRKPSAVLAIFFLDLDQLKPVNDAQGHAAGDQLLVEFSRRLKGCIRPHDIAARMGGDEFTVLLEDVRSEKEVTEVAVRILESLKDPFRLESGEVSTTVSIGIAFSDCGAAGPDDLLKAADAAMYRAKTSGKARYEIHRREAPDLPGNP